MKVERVIYHASHDLSEAGRTGYVGCSLFGLEHRKAVHIRDAKRGTFRMRFHAAIRKYGPEVLEWTILEAGFKDDESMHAAEIKWIELLGTKGSGYNLTRGGEGAIGVVKGPMSLEQKEKLRRANLGRKASQETIAKMKLAQKMRVYGPEWGEMMSRLAYDSINRGTRNIRNGWHHSREVIQRISSKQKGIPKSDAVRVKMRESWARRKAAGTLWTPAFAAMIERNFSKGRTSEVQKKAAITRRALRG